MKKIVLLCAGGVSTGVLTQKMKAAAAKESFECMISAHPISQAKAVASDADIILLGPQVRFDKAKVIKECPGIPCEAVDMAAYGRLDGAKVIQQVRKTLNC